MDYDPQKLEDAVLALLGASEFDNGRVWKRYDFGLMETLHARGYITDPYGRSESVHLTEAGLRLAKQLAARHFGQP